MDLFSRKIKGWSLDENIEEELVHSALGKAVGSKQLIPGSLVSFILIVLAGRGRGQYIGKQFRQTSAGNKFEQSMSRLDDPYDNAFMESYRSRLKAEFFKNGTFSSF